MAWGGQLMLEIGTTEGGAPYGLTMEEFRRANESSDRRRGWATAKRVLREALPREPSGPYKGGREDEDIGWVRHLGSGLSYDAYYVECLVQRGPASESAILVVRLPRRHATAGLAERALRELRVLQHLGTQQVPLRLPRVLGAVPTTCGLAFVQEAVFGTPLDPRSGRQPWVKPWEVVAEVAAACHAVDPQPLLSAIPSHPTRRDHALSNLTVLEKLKFPEASEALAWARENVPPPEPSCLLHGDLLGQNIILDDEGSEPPGLLDWEYAEVGDPADDLAIVTRGARRPFQVSGGLERLMDCYNHRTGRRITVREVRLHELCLKAQLLLGTMQRYGDDSPAAECGRREFGGLLRRVLEG